MQILQKLPEMDKDELLALEKNASRLLTKGAKSKKEEAEQVLLAIGNERRRRNELESKEKAQRNLKIARSVEKLGLRERVVLAFREMPPLEWEIAALQVIASHPGRNFHELAHELGKRDGGYMNLAVGSLCSARECYLGNAPMSDTRKGEKFFSGLLVELEFHREADGSTWHGWSLKPEALAGLREIKIVK